MRKPDFFMVGAAKAGTTSLHQYLAQHPQLFFPEEKEPHFFGDQRPPYTIGLFRNVNEYLRLFEKAPRASQIGEASTGYLYSRNAAAEIYEFNSAAKIIIILRNPTERAYSLYWHQVRDFEETGKSFEEALKLEKERIARNYPFGFHYVESGKYYRQVKQYIEIFDRKNVSIFLMEDLEGNAESVCQSIFCFLNVDSGFRPEVSKIFNRSGPPKSRLLRYITSARFPLRALLKTILPKEFEKVRIALVQKNIGSVPPMRMDTREKLVLKFGEDIESLEKLIGRDLSVWKN